MIQEQAIYGFIVGAILLLIWWVMHTKQQKIRQKGMKVMGSVSAIHTDYMDGSKSFYPIVRYETIEGKELEETYSMSTYPSVFKKGQQIEIIYDLSNPKEFIIVDKKLVYFENLLMIIAYFLSWFLLW